MLPGLTQLFFNIRNVAGSDKAGDDFKDDFAKVENLDQAIAEIERLRKDGEKLQGDLSGMEIMVFFGCLDLLCIRITLILVIKFILSSFILYCLIKVNMKEKMSSSD